MHFLSATARLPVPTLMLVICFVLRDVAALGHEFQPLLKRQGCSSAEIRSQCLTVGSDPSECIDFICDSCTELDPTIASCCQRSGDLNKAQCISDNLDTDSSDGSTASSRTRPTSSFPTTTAPADANAGCSSLSSKQSSCKAATPGFEYIIAWSSQASCFCYSSSSYVPRTFDNYYSSCLSYLETADTELYSSYTIGNNVAISTPCASIGNLEEATTRGRDIVSRTPIPGSTPTGAGNSRPTPVQGSGGISSRVGVCVF
ncbi:MAG: hypothetical protein Q9172_006812 [Xanthocarpia lactea]